MAPARSAHGLTSPRATDWRDRGACNGEDPELFAPEGTIGKWVQVIADAKAICNRCPVRAQCLEWALDNREDSGIYGGLTEDERYALLRQTGRLTRRPVGPERGPRLPLPKTLQELFDRHVSPATAGHLMWIGPKTPIFLGRQLTPGKVAFTADRGREPEGLVKRTCEVRGCVQPAHLGDELERCQSSQAAA